MTIPKIAYADILVVSTHMPLARHDAYLKLDTSNFEVSTHMPLARHDAAEGESKTYTFSFYSHASCEA